jgi:hypothetical protein
LFVEPRVWDESFHGFTQVRAITNVPGTEFAIVMVGGLDSPPPPPLVTVISGGLPLALPRQQPATMPAAIDALFEGISNLPRTRSFASARANRSLPGSSHFDRPILRFAKMRSDPPSAHQIETMKRLCLHVEYGSMFLLSFFLQQNGRARESNCVSFSPLSPRTIAARATSAL